ncbi:MAG: hypothetical protein QOG85_155 [Gaiellaceae bacterium]|jgi:hypothetical protein|nr:hypothetical protein [Gaiellaceae bacterium]
MPPSTKLQLLGTAEVAKILGITKQAIADRRRYSPWSLYADAGRPEFPKPIAELACGPIWDAREIHSYKRRYQTFQRRIRPYGR